jgi:hypothetical protein
MKKARPLKPGFFHAYLTEKKSFFGVGKVRLFVK